MSGCQDVRCQEESEAREGGREREEKMKDETDRSVPLSHPTAHSIPFPRAPRSRRAKQTLAVAMSESAKCTGAHYAKWEQKRNFKLAQKRLLKVGPIVNSQPSRKRKRRRRPGRGRGGRHLVGGSGGGGGGGGGGGRGGGGGGGGGGRGGGSGLNGEEPNQFKRRELKQRAKKLLQLTSDEVGYAALHLL